ncbi:MAG TPA: hypothetical protein VLV83_13240 [Acidobacteriota bacterium]|nr:hypothetical protein [Acidobacteriota bacterium]
MIFIKPQLQAPPKHWFEIVPIGDPFPSATLASPSGQRTSTEDLLFGKWTVLSFLGSPSYAEGSYPPVIQERFGHDRIQFVSILPGDTDFSDGFMPSGLDFWYDVEGTLERTLEIPSHVREHAYWTFLVDPSGRVDFSMVNRLKPEELRMLVESRLADKRDPLETVPPAENVAGTQLPDLRLLDWEESSTVGLPKGEDFSLVYFPGSSCADCAANKVQIQISRMSNMLSGTSSPTLYVVLSRHIPFQEVKTLFEPIKGRVYRTAEDYPLLEDPYLTLAGIGSQPYVLTVSARGLVERKIALEDWLQIHAISN